MGYRFEDFVRLVNGRFICVVNGDQYEVERIEDINKIVRYKDFFVMSLGARDGYVVVKISESENSIAEVDAKADWVKVYQKHFGGEMSFF